MRSTVASNVNSSYIEVRNIILPTIYFIQCFRKFYVRSCSFCLNKECAENQDLWDFVDSSLKGTLYEDIRDKLDLPNKDTAKLYSFKLFFGPVYRWDKNQNSLVRKRDSKHKSILREQYATVVDMIDFFKEYCTEKEEVEYKKLGWDEYNEEYKKSYWRVAYAKFSVMLQQFESKVFIDKTFNPKLFEGECILSRHVSFLYTQNEQKEYFEENIRKYLFHGAAFSYD